MVIDWSATAAWIALMVAVISPVFVALANNWHERRMYKLREYQEKQSAAITEYLSALNTAIVLADHVSFVNYCRCYGLVSAYIPACAAKDVDDLHDMLLSRDRGEIDPEINVYYFQRQYTIVRGHFYRNLKP